MLSSYCSASGVPIFTTTPGLTPRLNTQLKTVFFSHCSVSDVIFPALPQNLLIHCLYTLLISNSNLFVTAPNSTASNVHAVLQYKYHHTSCYAPTSVKIGTQILYLPNLDIESYYLLRTINKTIYITQAYPKEN